MARYVGPPGQPPSHGSPRSPRNSAGTVTKILIGIVVLVVFLWVVGVMLSGAPITPVSRPAGSPASTTPYVSSNVDEDGPSGGGDVSYAVEGKGRANVTYSDDSGTSSADVELPWRLDKRSARLPVLTAAGGGKLSCVIIRNGREIARTTGSGAFAMCAANGEVFE